MVKCLLLFLFSLPVLAEVEPGQICETRSIMTLPWTICLADDKKSEKDLRAAIEDGMKEITRIDEWMSEWKPNSLISEINKNAGVKPVPVTDEALEAISLSLKYGDLSEGSFDITFNAFFGLYSWKKGQERFPSEEEIKKLLPLVNYKNVIVDKEKKTVYLKEKGMKIGLGGMGEGWAVDKVFELLSAKKIQSGYIDASGAVRLWGVRPSGKLWTVGVGDPRPMNPSGHRKEEIYKMYLTDISITTSGDAEKYFVKDGRRYHHIIDPKTGRSADKSIQVTTLCKSSATLCDLVDNGVYILGPEKGKKFAESQGVHAIIIDPKMKIHFTKDVSRVDTQWGPALKIR